MQAPFGNDLFFEAIWCVSGSVTQDSCFIGGYWYSPFNTDSFGMYNLKFSPSSDETDDRYFYQYILAHHYLKLILTEVIADAIIDSND